MLSPVNLAEDGCTQQNLKAGKPSSTVMVFLIGKALLDGAGSFAVPLAGALHLVTFATTWSTNTALPGALGPGFVIVLCSNVGDTVALRGGLDQSF